MKKLILAFAALLALPAMAQTNFRSLTLDQAVEQAKKENKLVFVDFYTDWCGPCKVMARDVFPQKKVGDYFNQRFVCIKLNAEKEGKQDAQTYQVKAYPTFLVLDTDKNVKLDIKGSMTAETFLSKIESELNPQLSPEAMKKRYDNGERTPDLINAYAFHFMEQRQETEGYRIVNDYFNSLTDAQKLAAENFFLFSRYTVSVDDPKADFYVTHRAELDPTVREQGEKHAQQLYRAELVRYMSGFMFAEGKYDEAAFQTLKQTIIADGLAEDYPYAPLFELVECYAKGDKAAYLELLKRKQPEMNASDFDLILLNFSRLFPDGSTDEALRAEAAKYIRSMLPTLKPSTIMMMGQLLLGLEGK